MKNIRLIVINLFLCAGVSLFAQGYNEEQIALALFVERMYNSEPFEGCRIVDDYDNSYMLAVVVLDKSKYSTASVMNRVAQVKSQRIAGEFFNGSQSYSEFVVKTPLCVEKGGNPQMVETLEIIKVNSIGYVKQMQLLTSFDSEDASKVFVFYKKVE